MHSKPKPIFLKIAPDLTLQQIDDVLEIIQNVKLAGIVATNTTINRDGLITPNIKVEELGLGGLSGKPLRKRSTEIIKYIHNKTQGTLPIIAVGGIFNAKDAQEKMAAGASLVQVYTGFIYTGPGIVKNILKSFSK